jgi:hypothetical protein
MFVEIGGSMMIGVLRFVISFAMLLIFGGALYLIVRVYYKIYDKWPGVRILKNVILVILGISAVVLIILVFRRDDQRSKLEAHDDGYEYGWNDGYEGQIVNADPYSEYAGSEKYERFFIRGYLEGFNDGCASARMNLP